MSITNLPCYGDGYMADMDSRSVDIGKAMAEFDIIELDDT